ncbi:hypothetical protein BKA82DRAFT_4012969 [Pisolithus tinctorius]|nr:hypothetical protein BKA82DRAFT_4012969 [Pisolithus tinctorius]
MPANLGLCMHWLLAGLIRCGGRGGGMAGTLAPVTRPTQIQESNEDVGASGVFFSSVLSTSPGVWGNAAGSDESGKVEQAWSRLLTLVTDCCLTKSGIAAADLGSQQATNLRFASLITAALLLPPPTEVLRWLQAGTSVVLLGYEITNVGPQCV